MGKSVLGLLSGLLLALATCGGALASGAARPIDDHRGSIEFRHHLVRVLTRRTLTTALERAGR